MPFTRPTLADLRARLVGDLEARLQTGPLLPRGILPALAHAEAAYVHHLHGHVAQVADQLFPETAELSFLERASERYGIARKSAERSVGTVIFNGVEGTVVPVGAVVRRADGFEYETTASGAITSPSFQVELAARAVVGAASGNVAAGTGLTAVAPVLGITSAAEVGAGGFELGADAETDNQLRDRVLRRLREPPQGAEVYVRWALEVPGVTRAWSFPVYLGQLGHVGLAFAIDDDPLGPIPGAGKVAEVLAYVEERRPVGVSLTVFAPLALPLDVEVQIEPDTAVVRQAIEDALVDLLRAEGGPGRRVPISHVRQAISNAYGEADHVLVSPLADVTAGSGEIHVLGTSTFSAIP